MIDHTFDHRGDRPSAPPAPRGAERGRPTSARALRERLDALNRERGRLAEAAADRTALADLPESIAKTLSTSLAERLARLRPFSGAARARQADPQRVAAMLGGVECTPGVVRIERTLPLPWRHGRARLPGGFVVPPALLGRDAIAIHPPIGAQEIVLFDTETTGLAGGTGTVAFMLGTLGFRERSVRLTQWVMLGFGAEAAMLEAFAAYVASARMLVTFNGATFDLPLLRTRLRMQALPDCTADLAHVDLLGWARRNRRAEWGDVRLQTLEREGLGFERVDDLPGEAVPKAWQRWLQAGETGPLARALEHNRNDLLTLAALLGRAIEFPGRGASRSPTTAREVQPWLFEDPAPWLRATREVPVARRSMLQRMA